MFRGSSVSAAMVAFALSACGPVEVKISKNEGVKPIQGTLVAVLTSSDVQTFTCGDTITATDPNQQYTVTSQGVSGGCQFTFDQDVQILADSDYSAMKEFKNEVRYVSRVELEIKSLKFSDADGTVWDLDDRIRDPFLSINGKQVIDSDVFKKVPTTIVLDGEPLEVIKRAVKAKQPCLVHITSQVTVLEKTKPREVHCDYDSQPTLVLSSTEI